MSNHNDWIICKHCGNEYDTHLNGLVCPKCGNMTQYKVVAKNVLILLVVLVLVIIAFSSCTPLKYKQRRHQNRVFQEVQQHQNSLNAHQDWTRVYRNWDRRPKGHWPFEFLQ